ncbi:hypothetical protein VN24_25555 [Paenibacillus beijingensis]|uniref:Uncharacterized protein n=1 Tax=Paenibacillus beijingensis TaxID=1126833 RepID=A0A0D5NPS6_9BACL|nr:hypothetical protein VN24_25555 [Paenibacillus beijingensis]
MHDYLDMLESDCLYGDEYDALFHAFGDMELAILAKIVFYEELRSESLDRYSKLEIFIFAPQFHMFVKKEQPEQGRSCQAVLCCFGRRPWQFLLLPRLISVLHSSRPSQVTLFRALG